MSLPFLMVSTAPFLGPCLLPSSLSSPGQNATESLKQVRTALERWHKAASVTSATRQSAGMGTGTQRLVSTCGSRAGTWGSRERGTQALGSQTQDENPGVGNCFDPLSGPVPL